MSTNAIHVLLMPEDVQGTPPEDAPLYGTVLRSSGPTATVRLLSNPQSTVQVRSALLRSRAVPDTEYDAGAPGQWLRKPVVGTTEGRYAFGQVISYRGSEVQVRTGVGEYSCPVESLVEIAPVLCFLYGWSATATAEIAPAALTAQHHLILDRLLGENGQSPTRSIPRLMRGIVPVRLQPCPDDTLRWTNAATGVTSIVRVRHAVDFAYYVDGRRAVPPRLSIGDRFDAGPLHQPSSPVASPDPPAADEYEVPNDGDLDALLAAIDRPDSQQHRPDHAPLCQAQRDTCSNHEKVLAAIADDPDLIRFYLGVCQTGSSKRPSSANADDEREVQRRRIDSPSDLILEGEGAHRRSKDVFSPSRPQRQINALLVSSQYVVSASPAIIVRIYAFEFGARGLTILHFQRFDFAARRSWYADGSVNLNNFGGSVPLPKAARPRSLDDMSNALTVLHVFAEEFFEADTCRLISAAREFVEELRGFCRWTASDTETLVFWFDRVFEDYRAATTADARSGKTTRKEIQYKFSLRYPELQSVLYVIQSERLPALATAPTPRPSSDHAVRTEPNRRSNHARPPRKTPREVIDALPRRGRQTVCMKYLSTRGCSSKSDDRCVFPNQAQFIPEDLDQVVRDHIVQHLGGLRPELRQ